MISSVFHSIGTAIRTLAKNFRLFATFAAVYFIMLAAFYFFVATSEASVGKVLLSLALGIAVLVLFFTFQTMSVEYTGHDGSVLARWIRSLRNSWKLLAISIIPALVVYVLVYLLGKLAAAWISEPVYSLASGDANSVAPPVVSFAAQRLTISALRVFLFLFVVPLVVIHLWMDVVRQGFPAAAAGAGRTLVRALAPSSVFAYLIGFVLFAAIPYVLLFVKTQGSSHWIEVTLLIIRDGLALLFILFGWLTTTGALSLLAKNRSAETQ